jgi:hypothetical protein
MKAMISAFGIVLAVLVLAGCVTPINWQARVGIYTYENSVMDYGPPDKATTLKDGTMVAEWMVQRGAVVVSSPGPYYYGPGYVGPVGPVYSTTSYFPAKFLRLTFSPDGKLQAWKEFSK